MVLVINVCFANSMEVFNFVKDYIQCLEHLKINNEKSEDIDSKKYSNEYGYTIEVMKNYRLAQTELQYAQDLIAKYRNSENELISQSSGFIYVVLGIQKDVAFKSLKVLEDSYAPDTMNNPENFHMGKYMSKLSELAAESDNSWQMLLQATGLVTHAMVDQNPDENGHLSYLVLTSQERKELIDELDNIYGGVIKDGIQPGQRYVDVCPAMLRQILAGDHKSADERK